MPDHSCLFEAHGGGLALANAILLYRHQGARTRTADEDSAAFASYHAVEHDAGGAPIIAAGVPLTRSALRQWTDALGRSTRPEILPEHVLIAHADMLAWWVPAQVRTAFFALGAPPCGLQRLSSRTTIAVPYPAHLFIATRSALGVYALPANRRPEADTRLLCSPILNVFANGTLCWGNIAKPRGLGIASIPAYERAVFESWSTHPNAGQERSVRFKGGLVRLWDDLAARGATRFPVSRLRPFTGTAGRVREKRAPVVPLTFGTLVARART